MLLTIFGVVNIILAAFNAWGVHQCIGLLVSKHDG